MKDRIIKLLARLSGEEARSYLAIQSGLRFELQGTKAKLEELREKLRISEVTIREGRLHTEADGRTITVQDNLIEDLRGVELKQKQQIEDLTSKIHVVRSECERTASERDELRESAKLRDGAWKAQARIDHVRIEQIRALTERVAELDSPVSRAAHEVAKAALAWEDAMGFVPPVVERAALHAAIDAYRAMVAR